MIYLIFVILLVSICIYFYYNEKYNNKPEIINNKSDIAIIYLYTPNIYNYAKHSLKNIKAFIDKYKYDLIIYNYLLDNSISPCWSKILAILYNLKNYKYVIWIDSDAIINNFDYDFNTIIHKYFNKDLLICKDINYSKECINSGVMIIKNSDWSFNLFNKVWNSNEEHIHNDQNVLYQEIINELFHNTKLYDVSNCNNLNHPKIALLSEKTFNSHILNFTNNDFILHLMGLNSNSRINIMRQINTKLGLDNFQDTKCIDLFNNKIESELIIKYCYK